MNNSFEMARLVITDSGKKFLRDNQIADKSSLDNLDEREMRESINDYEFDIFCILLFLSDHPYHSIDWIHQEIWNEYHQNDQRESHWRMTTDEEKERELQEQNSFNLMKEAIRYAMRRGFVRLVSSTSKEFLDKIIIPNLKTIKDDVLRDNMIRYSKIAFGTATKDDVDFLYDWIKNKIALGRKDDSFKKYEAYQKGFIWSDGFDVTKEDWETFRRSAHEVFEEFESQPNKVIACDVFISRWHSYERDADESVAKHQYFSRYTMSDEMTRFKDSDHVPQMNEDERIVYELLNAMEQKIWCDDEQNLINEYAGEDEVKEDDEQEVDLKKILERNSEHKRKILKSTKRKKIQETVKRHIFRKNVSG